MSTLKKLKKNNYKKPEVTYTEKLTKEEIADKLEDYKMIDDINDVSVGAHLRYFIIKDGKKLFRMGGRLINKDGLPDYIVLTNGKTTWSVQTENATFFEKMSFIELKNEFQQQLAEKNFQIKALLHEIKKYKKQLDLKN